MDTPKGYRLFHIFAMLFVGSLIVSNTIAVKIVELGGFMLPAGIIVFPVSYILADTLTECYGFRKTRSIIWWGFISQIAMVACYWLATQLTPAPFWGDQEAFARLFGFVPRIVGASMIAYLVGEFLNSMVLSKIKVAMGGRHLWLRAIASTIVGQGADSLVFNLVAFGGVFAFKEVLFIAFSGWVLKTAYEVVILPVTYIVVAFVKRREDMDVYDRGVRYSLFERS